jgi:BirA family biotin operon repressor/biotin-[acetyl-CoA-carboxylase] ligase
MQLHAEATSTNALAADAPTPNLVVVADHQTAGRGRLDRSWVTPRGAGLTFSAVVDPGVPVERWPLLPLATGLAVVDAVRRLGADAGLKWPNDVLVADRKLCGILVERVGEPPLAVLGLGINVDMAADELPVPTATSLAVEGFGCDRTALLADVLGNLGGRLEQLRREPEALLSDYRAVCATLGRSIQAFLPGDRVVRGRATGVDSDGRLVVETSSEAVAVSAGDVVHVRPAG